MEEPICRICLEPHGNLFSPCLCSGTMKYVHETCLDTWHKKSINALSSTRCEQCRYTYRLQSHYVRTLLIYSGCVGLVGYSTNAYYTTSHHSMVLGVNMVGVVGLLKLATSPIFVFMCMTLVTTDLSLLHDNINVLALIILVTGNYNVLQFIDSLCSKRILSRTI
jgi:hypothetical protein